MTETIPSSWTTIIDAARYYPSPHNSQPIKISIIDDMTADVYYDLDLGLPAESYGIPFAHVCAGVFLESLSIVAANSGYTVSKVLVLDELDFTAIDRLHKFARVTLVARPITQDDRAAYSVFLERRTSRLPYNNQLVPQAIVDGAQAIADAQHYSFKSTSDKEVIKDIVRINQSTLFDDLQNDDVYTEIMHWLRFSNKEAHAKGDGLSAETMLMPGKLLHFSMKHRGMWSYPIIGGIIRSVYLRTMKGVRQLGWIEGAFSTPSDYIEAGRTFMKIWMYFAQNGVYLHPFGTVITNPRSHKQFVKKAGITEDDNTMAWMLFRFGYSDLPPKAFRRPTEVMIIKKEIHG